MNAQERLQKQRCLCCGKTGVTFFRLRDGRVWASCQPCLRTCDLCLGQITGSVELDEAALQEAINSASRAT